MHTNTERIELTTFITTAYPQGTGVGAPANVAPVLAYHGYPASIPKLPDDPSFMTSTLRNQGYRLIVTQGNDAFFNHYSLVYDSLAPGGYRVYEIPNY